MTNLIMFFLYLSYQNKLVSAETHRHIHDQHFSILGIRFDG